jgi:oxalate decarboxylase/phosphoglucose isomerase-like protein (cupin superfamily)
MLHRHDPFELYRVEHGELTFYIEDDGGTIARRVAGPGEMVPIPGGREHTVRNESGEAARAFVVFSPAGEMEAFARAAAALATVGALAIHDIPALAATYGITIMRPDQSGR